MLTLACSPATLLAPSWFVAGDTVGIPDTSCIVHVKAESTLALCPLIIARSCRLAEDDAKSR